MASSDSLETHTIFYGAVINPVSLTSYSILPQCMLSIDPSGKIEWRVDCVERHMLQETLALKGHIDVDVVSLKDGRVPHARIHRYTYGTSDCTRRDLLYLTLSCGHSTRLNFQSWERNQYQLLDWLEKLVFPAEAQFKDEHYARKMYKSVVRRVLDSGTTTCCYYGSLHLEATKILADIAHAYGQRAFIGKCNMNRYSPAEYVEPSTEVSVETTHSLISHIRGLDHHSNHPGQEPLIQPILAPRFALSCTRDLLTTLGDLAASDPTLRIETHLSENKAEVVETLKEFREAESYAGVYDLYGLLRHNTILGHAVHITKQEVELIRERGAGISHCPTSNFNLNSGIAPIGYFLDRGVKVGLGTDVSGGVSPSILTNIQHARIASKVLSFNKDDHDHHGDCQFADRPLSNATLLYLATAGGAAVCTIDKQVGSFDLGKSFDALLVNIGEGNPNPGLWGKNGSTVPYHGTASDAARPETWLEEKKEIVDGWLERFLHCGDDRNIERVYVQGRFVGGRTFRA